MLAPAIVLTSFCIVWIARSVFYFQGRPYLSLFDDAMISMRYARNFGVGHGLVWNSGGRPIEGYTNFGWTLWMAAIHVAGLDGPIAVLIVMVSAIGLTLAGLWVVRAISEELTRDPRVATAAVWLTALAYPLAYWAVRGMEVALLAFTTSSLALGLLRLRRGRTDRNTLPVMALLMGVALLVRTDEVVVCGTVGALALLAVPRERRFRTALTLGGSSLGVLGAHTLFRILYYGEALPNTYYLKVAGAALGARISRGVDATTALTTASVLPLVYFAMLGLWSTARTERRHQVFPLVAIVVTPTLYSIYVGADAWENMQFANRYIAPSLPLLCVLAARGIVSALDAPESRRRSIFRALAALALLSLVSAQRAWIPTLGLQYVLPGTRELADRTLWALGAALLLAALPLLDKRRAAISLAAAIVAVAMLFDGQALGTWLRTDGPHVGDDATMAIYGLVIRHSTTPTATVAVMWAGASPYYSTRDSIDLLGKSDAHIARGRPQAVPFYPGHTKWDYAWSVDRLRPDLVADIFRDNPGVDAKLSEWGYDEISPKIWVRHDSAEVDRAALSAGLAANPRITALVERHL
ncbi:MAG: hypothetical protein NVS3B21_01090 [Acidimicrobiales bacterium]